MSKNKNNKAVVEEVLPVEEPIVVEEVVEEMVVDGETVADGEVQIVSADNRVLEASIGERIWKGTTITVPAEQEEDVRRILEDGGFFIK